MKRTESNALLLDHEKVPTNYQGLVEAVIERVGSALEPHIRNIVKSATEILPPLNNVVVLLTDEEGGVAAMRGTLPPRTQLAALENAIVLTKKAVKATGN